MAQLKLFVLGQPRLERDGAPIELNLRKALALLVYLAMSRQPHSRDALATLLWPESDGREARARLRRTLHRLNETIAEVLDSSSETIRLYPDADLWLDCAAFRRHATAGLAAAPQDTLAPERLANLNAAVELYAEDFLAGFTLPDSPAFDEWQFFQRESLRQLYGQVLEQLVQAYRARHAWDQAIAYARRWLALDALHEPAHRTLMRLYAWAGQHSAALRQYQECARILAAELAAEPEDETTALYEAIRTRQLGRESAAPPAVEPPAAHDPPAPAPHGRDPSHASAAQADSPLFVARQRELSWLDDQLAAALAGRQRVAFVAGEAGQGKSALLRAFARAAQAAHPELVVAWGGCNAYTGMGDPYLPFRQILELLAGNVDVDTPAVRSYHDSASRLRHGLPAAAQALVEAGPDLLDTFVLARALLRRAAAHAGEGAAWVEDLRKLIDQQAARPSDPRQHDLFEQYARVLQALARRSALLLILDDLQWADSGSADLLLHLARRLGASRVLIVGAYRPADVALGRGGERHPMERVLGELRRDFGEIRLDLDHAEGRPLVEALLDSEPNQLDEAFRAALHRQTGGHPLFTIELLRDMQERGAIARDAQGRWNASPGLLWTRLPARVEGVIGERIGRLDARLRELLQAASVEGEEFTAEVIARVVGADDQQVVRQLSRELDQAHHLVRALGVSHDDGPRRSRYRFQHILIQRYLYGSLDDVERVYLHEAVGHALEARCGARAAEIAAQLAWHFAAARLPAKAGIYGEQAGDRARRSAAFDEAAHYYRAALEAWPPSDLAAGARLLRKLGECQWITGQLQDARATFEACYALYESLGDREGAGAIQRLIGRLYWEQGDRERSLRHYDQALALLEAGPESVELAWAISSISQMHMLASANDEAIGWGQRALAMAERLGAEEVAVHALANIGSACFGGGDAERGRAMLRRSWRRAVELNLPFDACRAANNLGVSLAYYGMPAEARAVFEELQAYAVRMQMHLNAGLALISLAKLDWLTGRWRSVLARREEILAWIDQGQSSGYLEVLANTMFAWMHNDLGQPAAAREMLERARTLVDDRAEIHTTGPHLGQQVRALGALEREEAAAAAARQFLELSERQVYWDTCMSHLVVCRWLAGRAGEAGADLLASLARIERAHAQFGGPATAAALDEARGVVAAREGAGPRSVEYLRQAAAGWQAIGYPYDEARALIDLGRALGLAGDAAEALAALDRARGLVETLAAQLDAADQQAAFLDSPLARELGRARAAVLAAPVDGGTLGAPVKPLAPGDSAGPPASETTRPTTRPARAARPSHPQRR